MLEYIIKRSLAMIPLLFLVSVLSFVIIQLPPGDYVESYRLALEAQGGRLNEAQLAALSNRYGLNKPLYTQYFRWIKGIVTKLDFGQSFRYDRPVMSVLGERIPRTVGISLASLLLTWIIAVPFAIFSALRQYSIWDYLLSFLNIIGLAVPGFLLALILLYLVFQTTGYSITGLYSEAYQGASWSISKLLDLFKNLWLPIVTLGISGTAGIMRVLRATLLDELNKPYVTTARAKGLPEWKVILKYPVRIAINPLVSTIGWLLPSLIGGEIVVSKVLNIPTTGPVLLNALMVQDMYLAGGIVMILSCLTVVGTLISDVLLALTDPRIRYD
jgi:peptide/nickel transport system permease protein